MTDQERDQLEQLAEGADQAASQLTPEEPLSKLSPSVVSVSEALMRGDFMSAKKQLASIDSSELNDDDKIQVQDFQKRLSMDPVEFYVPIVLFVFWMFIFWRTTH